MVATIIFNFPYRAARAVAVILAMAALLAGAMVATAMMVTALTPVIGGCCVAAGAAVVAALPALGCAALIVAFAWWFKP